MKRIDEDDERRHTLLEDRIASGLDLVCIGKPI